MPVDCKLAAQCYIPEDRTPHNNYCPVDFKLAAQCYIPEDRTPHNNYCENLGSYTFKLYLRIGELYFSLNKKRASD
jgi:hypothetical protein